MGRKTGWMSRLYKLWVVVAVVTNAGSAWFKVSPRHCDCNGGCFRLMLIWGCGTLVYFGNHHLDR